MSRRVLVTGGASGFGQALAAIYAARGDRVLITDLAHDVDALPAAAADGEVAYLRLDVRDSAAWEEAVSWVADQWGGLDLLINNAGVAAGGRVEHLTVDDWEWIVDINLLGVVRGCRTVVPLLKRQRNGRIVNVASLAGHVHAPFVSSYNAVKAAVVALSETLLHELAPYDVDVSVVCPSFFKTNLDQSLRGSDLAMEDSARRLITHAQTTADEVAARTVKALDKGTFPVIPDAQARLVHRTKRLAPPAYHRLMKRTARRVTRKISARERAARRG